MYTGPKKLLPKLWPELAVYENNSTVTLSGLKW